MIELPSHVFERFATDPEALALFCHHSALTPGGSPTPPPTQLLHAVSASKRRFAALGLQGTLQLALIDQLLHGEAPPVGSQVERSIAELMQESSVMGYEPGTFPHLRCVAITLYLTLQSAQNEVELLSNSTYNLTASILNPKVTNFLF